MSILHRKINILFFILISLILTDIILTFIFVTFFGATEINPLCINFNYFIIVKILVSVIYIIGMYKLQTIPYWKIFIYINIIIYGGLLIFNLLGVVLNFKSF